MTCRYRHVNNGGACAAANAIDTLILRGGDDTRDKRADTLPRYSKATRETVCCSKSSGTSWAWTPALTPLSAGAREKWTNGVGGLGGGRLLCIRGATRRMSRLPCDAHIVSSSQFPVGPIGWLGPIASRISQRRALDIYADYYIYIYAMDRHPALFPARRCRTSISRGYDGLPRHTEQQWLPVRWCRRVASPRSSQPAGLPRPSHRSPLVSAAASGAAHVGLAPLRCSFLPSPPQSKQTCLRSELDLHAPSPCVPFLCPPDARVIQRLLAPLCYVGSRGRATR
ncbi:hypothetical protein B0H19DRAFT_706153 [Mycena capillaripes]|nr:hypothetical protein B0H19DRAFT_706153 [Mycena capillaripes]